MQGRDLIDSKQENKIEILEYLQHGFTASVYRARWNNLTVAVKCLHKLDEKHPLSKKHVYHPLLVSYFVNEASILSGLNHPNVIRMHGVTPETLEGTGFGLMLDFVPGDLWTRMKKNADINYVSVTFDIASGLAYLHKNNIAHLDIKPENILVDEEQHAKVCDLGLSIRLDASGKYYNHDMRGTYSYIAPEAYLIGEYSYASDIYALGILMWEMMTRKLFLSRYAKNPHQLLYAVAGGEREEIPENCDPEFARLIRVCWDTLPGKRPTAKQLISYLQPLLQSAKPQVVCREVATSVPRSRTI